MKRAAWLALAAAACASPPARAPAPEPEAPGRYRAEAAALRVACRGGLGDPVACRELAIAHLAARGVALDPRRAHYLLNSACLAGDELGCELRASHAAPDRAAAVPLAERCREDDYGACWKAVIAGDAPPGAARLACDGGAIASACWWAADALRDGELDRSDEVRRLLERACALGDEESCAEARDPDLATGCAATLVERVRSPFETFRGTGADGGVETLPGGTPLLLVAGTMIGDHPQKLAASRLAGLERGLEVIVLVEDLAKAPPGTDAVTVLEVPDVDRVLGREARLIDGAGQTRALFPIGLDRVPASFGRCVAALLDEP